MKATGPASRTRTRHPRLSRRRRLLLLGLAVHLLLPQITTMERAWATLSGLSPWLVGAAALAQAL